MKIHDIVELLKVNKTLAIITPNHIESKLLFDRFRYSGIKLKVIDQNTIEIDKSRLIFITPYTSPLPVATHYVIEFPESIPEYVIQNLPPADITITSKEIL